MILYSTLPHLLETECNCEKGGLWDWAKEIRGPMLTDATEAEVLSAIRHACNVSLINGWDWSGPLEVLYAELTRRVQENTCAT